ncbi:alginate lyase family protein [Erwinia sp. INIA-01]|uniref:alginate lyase family protein n=1 Tax=Erwinia sp. INIA01 TaxID=2991500 RepID=UPI002224611C|nr:alginate lyase family protein [Erwinia sp. INIA01]MCW1875798.1 alginate lyase family protein [Erwinia sp. INIA01]
MRQRSNRRAAFQGRPFSLRGAIPFLLLILSAFSSALCAQEYAFLNDSDLVLNRQRLLQQQAPEPTLTAWQALHRAADKALKQPLLSVTDKGMTPPSGSKHDYLSLSAYWWPDGNKPDGLPWVKRDGHVNPASKNEQSDGVRLATFTASVQTLTLAWYFSGDQRYADKAIALIRHWFINPATRMNPNLEYAQGVPGIADGRHTGVLDGRYFATRIVDSLIMLRQAPGWQEEDEQQIQRWMKDYLQWLLTSREGRGEAAAKNNHGSWYSAQVAGIAWYVQRPDVIRQMFKQAQRRMAGQLTADGRQPLELARTRSFHYSWFNLQALTALATVVAKNGSGDLWRYRTPQGSGLLNALDFMAPWSDGAKHWPYPSLDHIGVRLIPLLVQADNQLQSQRYRQQIERADWTLPAAGAARGATLDALRASWLLAVPAYSR